MKAMEKLDILEGNLVLEVGKSVEDGNVSTRWRQRCTARSGRMSKVGSPKSREKLRKRIL